MSPCLLDPDHLDPDLYFLNPYLLDPNLPDPDLLDPDPLDPDLLDADLLDPDPKVLSYCWSIGLSVSFQLFHQLFVPILQGVISLLSVEGNSCNLNKYYVSTLF